MMSDRELKKLLNEWQAPELSPELEETIFAGRTAWWKWPLTGHVRLPAPMALAALVLLAWSLFRPAQPAPTPPKEVDVADFQPVQNLNPRIVRNEHAND